jgi:hypothetical protein
MSNVSFPHYLCAPFGFKKEMRIVTDKPIEVGEIVPVFEYVKGVQLSFPITGIIEQRKARGNWGGHSVHPTWYRVSY